MGELLRFTLIKLSILLLLITTIAVTPVYATHDVCSDGKIPHWEEEGGWWCEEVPEGSSYPAYMTDHNVHVSISSGNTQTTLIPNNHLTPEITVDVTDNKVEGITTNTDKHIVVTTISPSSEVDNKIIKPDNNGTYSADLNPSEPGEHTVYVTQDTKTVQTTHNVEEDEVDLEIRLQILQTLQRILEIIFGK